MYEEEIDTRPVHCIPDDAGLDKRYFYFKYRVPNS